MDCIGYRVGLGQKINFVHSDFFSIVFAIYLFCHDPVMNIHSFLVFSPVLWLNSEPKKLKIIFYQETSVLPFIVLSTVYRDILRRVIGGHVSTDFSKVLFTCVDIIYYLHTVHYSVSECALKMHQTILRVGLKPGKFHFGI